MIYQIWEPNREMQKQIQISCFKQSDGMCIPRHHQVLQNPNQQENCSKIKHLIVSAGSFPNSCLQDIICNVSPRFCYNCPYSVLKSISTLFRKLCYFFWLFRSLLKICLIAFPLQNSILSTREMCAGLQTAWKSRKSPITQIKVFMCK